MTAAIPPIPFTREDAEDAADAWGFNCGPAALAVVLGKTPSEIRPHLLDFEQKGYTNPTLMLGALKGLEVAHKVTFRGDYADPEAVAGKWPKFGLVRVQWAGPWTKEGVPMRVRYRHSHWIAVRDPQPGERFFLGGVDVALRHGEIVVFDVNAVREGWLPFHLWRDRLVPWILQQCEPKANGQWWATHCIEVAP